MSLPPPIHVTRSSTNIFAIVGLISSVFFAPLGIVLGIVALHEIRKTGEDGRPLAVAGIWIGVVLTVITVLSYLAFFGFMWGFFTLIRDLPDFPTVHVPQ